MLSMYATITVSLVLAATAAFVKASSSGDKRWFWVTSVLFWAAAALTITRAFTEEPFVLAGLMFLFFAALQLAVGVLLNPPLFNRLYDATRRPDQL